MQSTFKWRCDLPAPRLSPARQTPCRDLCAPWPYTAHRYTSGRCDRTAPGPSDAGDRSVCPGGRFRPPVCASWKWPTRSGAWDASRSRMPGTSGRTWWLCASCPRRYHSPRPGVLRSCSRGTEAAAGRTRCCVGGWSGESLPCAGVWVSCCSWPCTAGRGRSLCGRHDPSRSSGRRSRRCVRTGWTRHPWGLPYTGSSPGRMTWLFGGGPCVAVKMLWGQVVACDCTVAKWAYRCGGDNLYRVNTEGG